MIDLREHSQPISEFLLAGLERFLLEHGNLKAAHVALYCCPWSGWISLCLNRTSQLDQNCPDFDFVEYSIYEASAWAQEYEAEAPLTVVDSDGTRHILDVELEGDDVLNGLFYGFLCELLASARVQASFDAANIRPARLGVQLLDSQYGSSWEPQR